MKALKKGEQAATKKPEVVIVKDGHFLNSLKGKNLFPEALEEANKIMRNVELPKRK